MYTSWAASSTSMPAGRPRMSVRELSTGSVEGLPICIRKRPSFVNLSTMRSAGVLPPIHTLPFLSTWMPCSVFGQSYPAPGPPQALSSLPEESNSSTGLAARQHMERCGVCAAPSSSGVSVPGRWRTQMWSWESTVRPPIWPMIQLLGSSSGQEGSTFSLGGCWAGRAGEKHKRAKSRRQQDFNAEDAEYPQGARRTATGEKDSDLLTSGIFVFMFSPGAETPSPPRDTSWIQSGRCCAQDMAGGVAFQKDDHAKILTS